MRQLYSRWISYRDLAQLPYDSLIAIRQVKGKNDGSTLAVLTYAISYLNDKNNFFAEEAKPNMGDLKKRQMYFNGMKQNLAHLKRMLSIYKDGITVYSHEKF